MSKNLNTTANEPKTLSVVEELNELLKDIKDGKIHCTYCAELATELDESNFPVCGIPGNH